MIRIGFIGTGKMAAALIKAVVKFKIADSIISSDKNSEKLKKIREETGINTAKNNIDVIKNSELIFLCIKPQDVEEVLEEIKNFITKKHLIVSIAAGITLSYLESKIKNARFARVMPNTPCLVGEMAAAYSLGKNIKEEDKAIIDKILNSAGKAFLLEEKLLDAVTGLSGSGPAFIAYIIEAFTEAGIEEGLSKEIAYKLALQTFLGTSKLLSELDIKPDELIKMVASPKGTTIEGIKVLENSDLKNIISKTVKAAARRSKELGKTDKNG